MTTTTPFTLKKMLQTTKKRQGKKQTPGIKHYERKIFFAETAKARKDVKKAKQQHRGQP